VGSVDASAVQVGSNQHRTRGPEPVRVVAVAQWQRSAAVRPRRRARATPLGARRRGAPLPTKLLRLSLRPSEIDYLHDSGPRHDVLVPLTHNFLATPPRLHSLIPLDVLFANWAVVPGVPPLASLTFLNIRVSDLHETAVAITATKRAELG
jgi:hypothetical protein